MKKLIVLAACLAALFVAPMASAETLNTNNFVITQYDIHYTLGRDSDNRSTLQTIETITADFPDINQNHGIERYIPKAYDKHPTSLHIQSVVDGTSKAWHYSTYDSGPYTVVRVGDADQYLHGQHTFQLTYTQRDVTKFFSDTNRDEFYWDTNGTGWQVPIQSLSVSVSIDPSLQSALTDNTACYSGASGETNSCTLIKEDTHFTTDKTNLAPGENVTIAIGFAKDSFAPYKKSLWEVIVSVWVIVQIVLAAISLILIIVLFIRYKRWSKRQDDIGTIVPEYAPPKDSSIQTAAALLSSSASPSFAAQIIDLAVRHYVKISEISEKTWHSSAVYEIEIIAPTDDLRAEEKEFVQDVFQSTDVGAKVNTKHMRNDRGLAVRMMDNPAKLQKLVRGQYGLQQKDPVKSAWFTKFSLVSLILGLLLGFPLLLVALIAFMLAKILWPLTDTGLALYRSLEGLKMYIGVAETERIRMLQSPDGATKAAIDPNDKKQLVKLYEKLLPYAILFGQEKNWNKQLGNYYESTGSQPDWYTGRNLAVFNAAVFSSAMTNLTTSISSSAATSSSSGGSGGGGFSGGGGGGGGGGGW